LIKMKRRQQISAAKIGALKFWRMLSAQWFELDLDPEIKIGVPELTQILEDHRTEVPLYGTTNVVTQYLEALKVHAEQILQRKMEASDIVGHPDQKCPYGSVTMDRQSSRTAGLNWKSKYWIGVCSLCTL